MDSNNPQEPTGGADATPSARHVPATVTPDATPPPPERVGKATRGLVLGTAMAILAVWLFIRLADEVMESATKSMDAAVTHFFLVHYSPPVHAIMAGITWAASGWGAATAAVLVALYFGLRHDLWTDGITMLVAEFGGILVDDGLKRVFHRERPEPVFYHLGYSFPSGHAFSAVVVCGMIAYFVSRHGGTGRRIAAWTIAVIAMLLIGFSRIYLRQHYLTDVLGGYLAGACWLWGCLVWLHILERRRSKAEPAREPA
jgi:undecaprenyl-diphosphatase